MIGGPYRLFPTGVPGISQGWYWLRGKKSGKPVDAETSKLLSEAFKHGTLWGIHRSSMRVDELYREEKKAGP